MSPGLQIRGSKFQRLNSNSRELKLTNLFGLVLGSTEAKILQVNIRWKVLAEIYTMHSFAPFYNLNVFCENLLSFANLLQNFAKGEKERKRNFANLLNY